MFLYIIIITPLIPKGQRSYLIDVSQASSTGQKAHPKSMCDRHLSCPFCTAVFQTWILLFCKVRSTGLLEIPSLVALRMPPART